MHRAGGPVLSRGRAPRRPGPHRAACLLALCVPALLVAGCLGDDEQAWAAALEDGDGDRGAYLVPWPTEQVPVLRLGVTPYLEEDDMRSGFAPLLAHLERRLGVPTRLVVTEGYSDLGEQMAAGDVDVGEISPLAYVEAKHAHPGLRVLLRQATEGATTYVGYVLARADDPAETLTAMYGRSVCYVDPQSTSGYLYPRAQLWEQGLDPDEFFGRSVFAGNHIGCLRKLLEGEVDAAAVFSGAVAQARREGIPLYRLKVVAKTSRIPYGAYCARPDLPRAAFERLRAELLLLSDRSPEGPQLVGRGIKIDAWTEADDADYNPVRRALFLARTGAAHRTAN